MAEKRTTINVDLPAGTQGKLREYCERRGIIQRALLGRLVEFFVAAPAPVRRVIEDFEDMDALERDSYAKMLGVLIQRLGVEDLIETDVGADENVDENVNTLSSEPRRARPEAGRRLQRQRA